MLRSNYEFTIRVNDNPVVEFLDDEGSTWVEGRQGSEYSLYLRNNSSKRIKVILSVDGLNVLSGDRNWVKGYIIDGYSYVNVPGWRKDGEGVNAFYFSRQERSYSNRVGKGVNNLGVIGAKVYEEYEPSPSYYTTKKLLGDAGYDHTPRYRGAGGQHVNSSRGIEISARGGQYGNVGAEVFFNEVNTGFSGAIGAVASATMDSMPLGSAGGGTGGSSATGGGGEMARGIAPSWGAAQAAVTHYVPQVVDQALGTGYGNLKEFKTMNIEFVPKSFTSAEFTIYYDDDKGLAQRGIYRRVKRPSKPSAFPNDGVPPPKF